MTETKKTPHVSVVIATYERAALLERLLLQLGEQDLPADEFEVIVVDDGSTVAVADRLTSLGMGHRLRVERQENAGAAAARHRGVEAARGDLIVIVDDDMQVGRDFLSQHLAAHPPGSRRAVIGAILPPPDVDQMPLFERWHQKLLEDFAARARAGNVRLRGNEMYTANVSFHRSDYLAVGGFDLALERAEDAELGLRLEASGVEIGFSEKAATINGSDHTSLQKWRGRAVRYGRYDAIIARKHAAIRHASPWRHFPPGDALSPMLTAAPSLVPFVARWMAGASYLAASGADRLGVPRLAWRATGITFGLDYYRGLRAEMGGMGMVTDLARYLRSEKNPGGDEMASPNSLRKLAANIKADHEFSKSSDAKYGGSKLKGRLVTDSIQKIGLQMMIAIRIMGFLRDSGVPLAAKIASRGIRHLYGSDIHWDAEFEPGVVIAHGFGIAISGGVRIGSGCILTHGVSIGLGIDPETRKVGEPTLERNVHVGPGAILLGPIVIGEGSKIQAGALLTTSVPRRSLVMAPQSEIRSRDRLEAVGDGGGRLEQVRGEGTP